MCPVKGVMKYGRVRDLERRHLGSLVGRGLLVRRDGVYEKHPDFVRNLNLERALSVEPYNSSEKVADERDRLRYEQQRKAFRKQWTAKEVISEEEQRKLRRWSRLRAEREPEHRPLPTRDTN